MYSINSSIVTWNHDPSQCLVGLVTFSSPCYTPNRFFLPATSCLMLASGVCTVKPRNKQYENNNLATIRKQYHVMAVTVQDKKTG